MSYRRSGHALPSSSPPSEAATLADTPSTNLTTFSPYAASGAGDRVSHQAGFNHQVPVVNTLQANMARDDVFLAVTPTTAASQLSPTAAAFTPSASVASHASGTAQYSAVESYRSVGIPTPSTVAQTPHGGVQLPRATGSVAPPGSHVPGAIGQIPTVHSTLVSAFNQMQVQSNSANTLLRDIVVQEGVFSTDENVTRAFSIANCPRFYPWEQIASMFSFQAFRSLRSIDCSSQVTYGVVTVSFFDTRDAKQAFALARSTERDWNLTQLTPKAYAGTRPSQSSPHTSNYEGQIVVTVFFNHYDNNPAAPVIALIKSSLSALGDVKAFHSLPVTQTHIREFRVEYFNVNHAVLAVDSLQETVLQSVVLTVAHYRPDVWAMPDQDEPPRLSATGRSIVPPDFDPEYDELVENLHQRPVRSTSPAPYGGHNHVSIRNIRAGVDVRTTIMLRNIPNKVTQAMLKDILDETSFGCYDFMYLRIDFANNCNVGYAFINFIEPVAIINFAVFRAGQRWNTFKSDKIAQISYATIQGKDCLVQKFRNSSVMLEDPTFRPKLFHTALHPQVGTEEKFPGPDNLSKMRRSMENAETIGLFAPRQGQAHREEQRRRRSQYDRGTPGAEYERYSMHSAGNRFRDPALSPPRAIPSYRINNYGAYNYYGQQN